MLTRPSQYSLSDLASRYQLELHGDGDTLIDGVGTLRNASASQASFLANPSYRNDLKTTRAGVVIVKAEDAGICPTQCLVASDPYLAYAQMAGLFDPRPVAPEGIHPSAVVDASAQLGKRVAIGPQVVIGAHCTLGDGCTIGPGTVIEDNTHLGSHCHLHANVSIGTGVRLGNRVIIHPGAVIGADGFGIVFAGTNWQKVPQLGGVVIGDDCEIGANTTIDRGAIEDTVLEQDVRVDNLVQIAHNVHIGAHTAIAAMVGIAGSARIGKYCLLAGGSGVQGHLTIADRVTVGARSAVFESITEAGSTWSSLVPAQPIKLWQRNLSRLRKLDEWTRKIGKSAQDTKESKQK